jgi:hypothetical protein
MAGEPDDALTPVQRYLRVWSDLEVLGQLSEIEREHARRDALKELDRRHVGRRAHMDQLEAELRGTLARLEELRRMLGDEGDEGDEG